MNTGARLAGLDEAEQRVLHVQRKLHEWASSDAERRFHDLWNLVCDEATLLVAWSRVSRNRGSRTAGIDSITRRHVEEYGVQRFLWELRGELKSGRFQPSPARERLIPKRDGRMRRLGIATLRDRVVQMALKLVLEPIFESEFYPSSYGFRPGRRAQDAIAEIHRFTSGSLDYEWVIEADIEACFDRISHSQVLGEVRRRVEDKRVLALVRSFLKAGVMNEMGRFERTVTGTPQGGVATAPVGAVASPLLANISLSALDERFAARWDDRVERAKRRRHGLPNYRLIRYADDFVMMVSGTKAHAQAVQDEVAAVLSPIGLRLSQEKTDVVHIDEGLDFLGWRIQRQVKRGTAKSYVYNYPSKKALGAIMEKVRTLTRQGTNLTLAALLHSLNPVLRGWTNYYRAGVSSRTFQYLRGFTWRRAIGWLRRKHRRSNWK